MEKQSVTDSEEEDDYSRMKHGQSSALSGLKVPDIVESIFYSIAMEPSLTEHNNVEHCSSTLRNTFSDTHRKAVEISATNAYSDWYRSILQQSYPLFISSVGFPDTTGLR